MLGSRSSCHSFETKISERQALQNEVDANAVSLYPNPAKDEVIIAKNKAISLDAVAIYDVTGRLINTVDLKNMEQTETIDVSQLQSGIYFLRIHAENATITKQLIKE